MLFRSRSKGTMVAIVVRTSTNILTSCSLYAFGCPGPPVTSPPISVSTCRVTLRNSGTSRNRVRNVSISGVSKMYPSGIQLQKRSSVSNVAFTKLAWFADVRISWHSWKICENSLHMVVFRFLVLAEVICSAE